MTFTNYLGLIFLTPVYWWLLFAFGGATLEYLHIVSSNNEDDRRWIFELSGGAVIATWGIILLLQ